MRRCEGAKVRRCKGAKVLWSSRDFQVSGPPRDVNLARPAAAVASHKRAWTERGRAGPPEQQQRPALASAPAGRLWRLAEGPLAPPNPRGRRIEPRRAPQSHPSAPQAAAGRLADVPHCTETANVRADRPQSVGAGRAATVLTPGTRVGHAVGACGAVESGRLRG